MIMLRIGATLLLAECAASLRPSLGLPKRRLEAVDNDPEVVRRVLGVGRPRHRLDGVAAETRHLHDDGLAVLERQ